jgi:peptidyl-tRNA hydrolase, PTH1 family
MYLIYGLGNPGAEYKNNRHNVGFLFLDYFVEKNGFNLFKKKNNFSYSLNSINKCQTALMKPLTYMNASGIAVTAGMAFFKAIVNNILVIYDDSALPFGKIRVRDKGSDGGHNGLKSIKRAVGRDDYKRIRIGIGAPEHKGAMISHVLGNFNNDDISFLKEKIFPMVEDALYLFLNDGINEAMNKYNGLDLSKDNS